MSSSSKQPASGTRKPARPPAGRRRLRNWPVILIGVLFGVIILGSVGFVGATTIEEHDSFCASCHTVPENTYVTRSVSAVTNTSNPVTDLASAHFQMGHTKGQDFSCIQCHRGDSSLGERIQTLALGARDTLVFISGKADPTIEKPSIAQPFLVNTACISCHETTLLTTKGTATHFHNWLPQTAQLVAQGKQLISANNNGRQPRLRTVNVSLDCTSCHLAHKTVDTSDPRLKMIDKTTAQAACDTCHKAAGERPETLDRLLRGERD